MAQHFRWHVVSYRDTMNSMRIQIDVSQMNVLNAERGVGMYTDLLFEHLKKNFPKEEIEFNKKPADSPNSTNPTAPPQHADETTLDLVHYPYFDLYFHTLPSKKRVKTVVTIHDVIPLIYPKQYKPGIRGSFAFWRQLTSLKTVDAVLTDSECSKSDIAKHLGYPAEKIHVVYLAGNPALDRQPAAQIQAVREKYKLPSRYVLYVGDINYNKNLPAFIEACAGLPNDISVVMVGRALNNTAIPEGKALHAALSKFRMEGRSILLTDVPREPASDLAAIFTGAVAYVQPSLYEGFGLSVLDAMQCGTPVVTSRTSSLREVAGDAAIYFHPKTVAEISDAMHKAVHLGTTEKAAMLTRAKKNLARFSWDETARQTYAVYKSVANP
jgi:glycosyltransferase involved in cell wall biosynthesis